MNDARPDIAACAEMLDEVTASDQFSGAVLIAQSGTPLLERAYGYACKGMGVRNHVDTKFNIGSMSKMFTALSIVQLAEQGRLSFEDAVSHHLPEYPREAGDRITIHHLLTHTSGMGSFWNESFESTRTRLRSVWDYLPLFKDEPLAFEPGERFRYSNAGFVVLGAVVERASGMTYHEYVRTHIFEPANMMDSGSWDLDEDVPNRAVGYVRETEGQERENGYPRTNMLLSPIKGGPAGGSYATVYDLLRFAQALQGHRLLSSKWTHVLLEPRVKMGQRGDAFYAYGFGCHDVGGVRIVGHNGGAPGVGAQLDMYLDLGYTVVILSNYDARASLQVVPRVRQALTAARP
jgi:CubicO group peptidase (beta-lactamase class C family)